MKLRDLAKPHIRDLRPYQGGKPIEELERELGIQDSTKLASNECPYPPSEAVLQALGEALSQLNRYPDGDSFYLRRALARRLDVRPENLFLGAGSDEILEVLVKCFVGPGDAVVYPWPSFAMYPIVTQGMGGTSIRVPLDEELRVDVDGLINAITPKTRLVFLANPNNPTGTSIGAEAFERLLDQLPEHVILVDDEAYLEYVRREDFPDALGAVGRRPSFITLRTFSKIHGLAGLRLGYGVAGPELIELLERARHPFNVNSLAQIAGCAALEDREHLGRVRHLTQLGLEQLESGLEEIGVAFANSDTNFILVNLEREAEPIYQALLRQGVIARPVAAFGLPHHLRVTVGLPEENKRFLEALRRELGK